MENRPQQKQRVFLLEQRREAVLGEVEAAQTLRELAGFVGQKRELLGWMIPSVPLKSQNCN